MSPRSPCVHIGSLRMRRASEWRDWRVRRMAGMSGRSILAPAGAVVLVLTAGCGLIGGPSTVLAAVPDTITVTSPDFDGKAMRPAFSCHGTGRHPAIHWSGAPAGT